MSTTFRADEKGIYHCPEFDEQFGWQRHGFGSRFGNPQADITLRQVHSDQIIKADNLADREREGDGLITALACLSIGVRSADCVPILLLDSQTRAVGAIHAGWRGSAAGIVERAVERLHFTYGSLPEQIYAAIGPCIRPCCYQVSDEVAMQFGAIPGATYADGTGKYKLDLAAANRHQLQAVGVPAAHIFDSQLCTSCFKDQFFSYRREPSDSGRMVAAICRIA